MVFWHRAFKVCFAIFCITFTLAIIALFANWLIPDDIFNDPAYSGKYVGVKEIITFIKAVDTADLYATVISGIGSIITYIGKEHSRKY